MAESGAPGRRLFSYRGFWLIVGFLLCLLAARQVLSVLEESQIADEGAHLVAGYSYWKTGDFRLNAEHPPLVKLLCALPLLPLRPAFSPSAHDWQNAEEWKVAKAFLYQNRVPADTLLFAGRLVPILLTLVLGFTIVWWARTRFGVPAALFSLLLFTFDPTIIALGRYIATDLAVTAFLFWSCLSWWAYLENGRTRSLLQTGLLTGLTITSKFSGLIVYPIFFLLSLLYRRFTPDRPPCRHSQRMLFLALGLLPFLIVYAMYFFDTRPALKDPLLEPWLQQSDGFLRMVAQIPIPAYYYLRGFQKVMFDMSGMPGHTRLTYLLGQISDQSSWLYFPVAFAVKTPLATLLSLLLCAALVIRKVYRRTSLPVVWLALGLPPLVYFLVSLTSHINIGVRHILPIYPFLFVLLGAILFGEASGSNRFVPKVCGLLLGGLLAIESLSIHPHYPAFFNSLAGGPRNGWRYLLDSNLDLGQDLKKLKRWTDQHAAAPLCLSYYGEADPKYYGISFRPLSSVRDAREASDLDCVVAVSAQFLFAEQSEHFRALRELVPTATIGYSIYVYDLRKNRREGNSW